MPDIQQRTSPLAVASLVAGLVVPLWPISSVTAIVLGVVSLRQMHRAPELTGRGLAVAGIVIGIAALVLLGVMLAAILWVGHQCRNGC